MAGLGETAAILARLRRQRASESPRPSGAPLEEIAEFGANPGDLRMLVYAPAALAANRPLVVVLHGCTQAAEAYAGGAGWMSLADRFGFALLCPEQKASNNANRCFNWFEPDDIRRGEGEAASIRNMVEAAMTRLGSDRRQVFVTGLSAGGAMAGVMLATYPDVFAGGGVIAGLPYGIAKGMPQAFAAMFQDRTASGPELGRLVREASPHKGPWPRVSVWHGSADTTVKPSNADAIVLQWLDVHGLDADASIDARGHQVWSRDHAPVVERRLIPGLGHGTPLATTGPEGVGQAGPFLLEAGVSSSLELLRFWGVAPAQAKGQCRSLEPVAASASIKPQTGTDARWVPQGAAKDEQGVGAVINRALKAAGLMK